MASVKIEDVRFSSSSIDDFFQSPSKIVKQASGKIRVANLNTLAGFQVVSDDQLIRISQQDFWHLGHDEEGYFIERLVDDEDGPIKG